MDGRGGEILRAHHNEYCRYCAGHIYATQPDILFVSSAITTCKRSIYYEISPVYGFQEMSMMVFERKEGKRVKKNSGFTLINCTAR